MRLLAKIALLFSAVDHTTIAHPGLPAVCTGRRKENQQETQKEVTKRTIRP